MNPRVAEIFRKIQSRQRTGLLDYERGPVRRTVAFHRGAVVAARSSNDCDRLGEVMVRHGRISEQNLTDASLFVRGGKRLGDALIELRLVKPEEVDTFVRVQLLEMVHTVLTHTPRRLRFKKQSQVAGVIRALSVTEIMMDAARHMPDMGPFLQVIRRDDKYLTLRQDASRLMEGVPLTPQQAFLVSRIDGSEPTRNVFSLSPLSEDETARTILGLMHAGIVDLQSQRTFSRHGAARAARS